MKVMIVNRHIAKTVGGSEIQCDLIAKNFKKLGVDVVYVAMEAECLSSQWYHIVCLRKYSSNEFQHIVNSETPDIIYWRYNKNNLRSAVLIAHKNGVRFVFSLSHINDITKWKNYFSNSSRKSFRSLASALKRSLIQAWNYEGINKVDGIVSLQNSLLSLLPNSISRNKCRCIYNSMIFEPDGEFKWSKPYVAWVANIKTAKQPEKMIELAKACSEYDVDFLMVGNIQESSYLYFKDSDSLPKNLHYLGGKTVHEVDAILNGALFMVHTCMPEGFGNNFIQAWYAGKPTITLCFDPDEIIQKYGLGFHSETMERFIEQTKQLLDDEKLRIEMGERAKNVANELFSSEKNAYKLKLYLEESIIGFNSNTMKQR